MQGSVVDLTVSSKYFIKGYNNYPMCKISEFDRATSTIDYFRAPFKTDGGRPGLLVKEQTEKLPKEFHNCRAAGKCHYVMPPSNEGKRQRKFPYAIWYETRYCPGRNRCTLNPRSSNGAHRKCMAIYTITVLEGYEDYFHLEIKGLHGPGFTVDVATLPIANEVS